MEDFQYSDQDCLSTLGIYGSELELPFNSNIKDSIFQRIQNQNEDMLTSSGGLHSTIENVQNAFALFCGGENQATLVEQVNQELRIHLTNQLLSKELQSHSNSLFQSNVKIGTKVATEIRKCCSNMNQSVAQRFNQLSQTRSNISIHIQVAAKRILRIKKRKLRTGEIENPLQTQDNKNTSSSCLGDVGNNSIYKGGINFKNVLRSPEIYLNSCVGINGPRKSSEALAEHIQKFLKSDINSVKTNSINLWKSLKDLKRVNNHNDEFPSNVPVSEILKTKDKLSEILIQRETNKSEENEEICELESEFLNDVDDDIECEYDIDREMKLTEDGLPQWPSLEEVAQKITHFSILRDQNTGELDSNLLNECIAKNDELEDSDSEEDGKGGEEDEMDDQEEAARIVALEAGTLDTNTLSGDDRLEMFRQVLDLFQWDREDNQIDFHEIMIRTVLPKIFTAEWETDCERILRMFKLDKHLAETFIICPRRYGKTVSVAMFCAAYMFMIPNATIAIFSTSKRTSGKMMTAIYAFMRDLPFHPHVTFKVKNSECIELYLNGNKREMWCYPGTVAVCFLFFSCSSFVNDIFWDWVKENA